LKNEISISVTISKYCQSQNTRQDLVDIIIPYLKAGFENTEFYIWVASNPLEAKKPVKSLFLILKLIWKKSK